MHSELSQTIVLADCNVAIVRLHCCGQSFTHRQTPDVLASLCCGVSQSNQILQPFCSPSAVASAWWSLLFDCWGFNALVNHRTCRCAQVKVKPSSLLCWISSAFTLCLERFHFISLSYFSALHRFLCAKSIGLRKLIAPKVVPLSITI